MSNPRLDHGTMFYPKMDRGTMYPKWEIIPYPSSEISSGLYLAVILISTCI
jgi:hypothetical protein